MKNINENVDAVQDEVFITELDARLAHDAPLLDLALDEATRTALDEMQLFHEEEGFYIPTREELMDDPAFFLPLNRDLSEMF